jgi:hypothetical protein
LTGLDGMLGPSRIYQRRTAHQAQALAEGKELYFFGWPRNGEARDEAGASSVG